VCFLSTVWLHLGVPEISLDFDSKQGYWDCDQNFGVVFFT